MKTRNLFLATLLITTTSAFAQSSEFEFEYESTVEAEEYVDPKLKPNTVVVEIPNAGEESIEVYQKKDGKVTRVSPYEGNITVGAGYEQGSVGGKTEDGQKYDTDKKGANVQVSIPLIGTDGAGKGGNSSTGANLVKLNLKGSVGQANTNGADVDKNSVYWGLQAAPTINLRLNDAPMVFEKGKTTPIVGLEVGPSIGLQCEHLDDKTKKALGQKNSNCAATVGGTFKANLWYIYGGVDINHKLGQNDDGKGATEVKGTIGIEIPLSHNLTDVNDNDRGHNPKAEDAKVPGKYDYYQTDSAQAASV